MIALVGGGLLVPVVLAASWLAVAGRASWSGVSYVAALALIAAGLVTARARARRGRYAGITRAGLALAVLTIGVRGCTAARGERLTMTTTGDDGARWAARVLDEADVAVAGARLLVAAGMLHDPDAPRVPDALGRAYDRLRAAEGDAPSPVVPTFLGLESPERADVIVVDGVAHPKGAVIFLHGFAGGFALPCWQLARAAREADLVTFCPSVGARGDWWTERGARTLDKTVALARRRGFERLYLAGLSNGAVGAAHLAPRMRGTFRGVILISGCAPDQPAPGAPVLVLQGRRDAMSGASRARAYSAKTNAQYVDLDAGHFAFLLREDEAHRAISAWLARH